MKIKGIICVVFVLLFILAIALWVCLNDARNIFDQSEPIKGQLDVTIEDIAVEEEESFEETTEFPQETEEKNEELETSANEDVDVTTPPTRPDAYEAPVEKPTEKQPSAEPEVTEPPATDVGENQTPPAIRG